MNKKYQIQIKMSSTEAINQKNPDGILAIHLGDMTINDTIKILKQWSKAYDKEETTT